MEVLSSVVNCSVVISEKLAIELLENSDGIFVNFFAETPAAVEKRSQEE
jgi:hypothetical protein